MHIGQHYLGALVESIYEIANVLKDFRILQCVFHNAMLRPVIVLTCSETNINMVETVILVTVTSEVLIICQLLENEHIDKKRQATAVKTGDAAYNLTRTCNIQTTMKRVTAASLMKTRTRNIQTTMKQVTVASSMKTTKLMAPAHRIIHLMAVRMVNLMIQRSTMIIMMMMMKVTG